MGRFNGEFLMEGELGDFPLLGVLSWLNSTGRSVSLFIDGNEEQAELMIREGQLIYTAWGKRNGEDALRALLGLRRGTFQLTKGCVLSVEPNLEGSTQELLLRCTVALDEGERVRVAS